MSKGRIGFIPFVVAMALMMVTATAFGGDAEPGLDNVSRQGFQPRAVGAPEAMEPCGFKTNMNLDDGCGAFWYLISGPPNSTREGIATIMEAGLDVDSLQSLLCYVDYDPEDEIGFGFPGGVGTPSLVARIQGFDEDGLPDDADIRLEYVLTFEEWTAQLDTYVGNWIGGYVTWDIADSGIVLDQLERLWFTVRIIPDGEGNGAVLFSGDEGDYYGLGCTTGRCYSAFYRNFEENPRWRDICAEEFGGDGNAINADMFWETCLDPFEFVACTPAADNDWAMQGNNIGRTNYTTASLGDPCNFQVAWSAEPGGRIFMMQPIVADGKVLVCALNFMHCYNLADGTPLWSFGDNPYYLGNQRGAPTVDGDSLVYVGGDGAQAFSCVRLSDGSVKWSMNYGGTDPELPHAGNTTWATPLVIDAYVYFTQMTGYMYKVDKLTGAVAAEVLLTDAASGNAPGTGMASNGVKAWVGTAPSPTYDGVGHIYQVDLATMAIDWELEDPSVKLNPGDTTIYPEMFPSNLAVEGDVLYYHSMIRDGLSGNRQFPRSGSAGAIDLTVEDGTGLGVLWVLAQTDIPNLGGVGFSDNSSTSIVGGPSVGPYAVYLNTRGLWTSTNENRGIFAVEKTLGVSLWSQERFQLGAGAAGQPVYADNRGNAPATVFCEDGETRVWAGNRDQLNRLYAGDDGTEIYRETFYDLYVYGTAVVDGYAVTVSRDGGPTDVGGSVVVLEVGPDPLPRLALDSISVFRTMKEGDPDATDDITNAFRNSGCADLTAEFVVSAPEDPSPAFRVLAMHPALSAAASRATSELDGFDALLGGLTPKQLAMEKRLGVTPDEEETLIRTFANEVGGAADPLFLTVNTAPVVVAPGDPQSINITYSSAGLVNNTGYTNYIELVTNDDYFFAEEFGADPLMTVNLFIGCPDEYAVMNLGLGEAYMFNSGPEADGDVPGGLWTDGDDASHFDGSFCIAVADNDHWAIDGVSLSSSTKPKEFGPTLPCGVNIVASQYTGPSGLDDVEEVEHQMIDLGSLQGYYDVGERQLRGLLFNVQRVGSQDATFGDFYLTRMTITNEVDDSGDCVNVYAGALTDWDITGTDNVIDWGDDAYVQFDGGGTGKVTATTLAGHCRLDAPIVGATGMGAGSAPVFTNGDFSGNGDSFDDPQAFLMLSDPDAYWDSVVVLSPAATYTNTDAAALISMFYTPLLAEGESVTFYWGTYLVHNTGAYGSEEAFDAAVADVMCRMKGFAGFGKGDVNCDGVVDLTDVVALGNVLDGLLTPTGGGIYTADVNGDNQYTQEDYDLLYDVVAGVEPASAMANAWRFVAP